MKDAVMKKRVLTKVVFCGTVVLLGAPPSAKAISEECLLAKEAFAIALETFKTEKGLLLDQKKATFEAIKEQQSLGLITPEEAELLREQAALEYESAKAVLEQTKDDAEAVKDAVCVEEEEPVEE